MANDTSSESSESASAAIGARNLQEITEENVTQVHVIQMLKALVNQSSNKIQKVIIFCYNLINQNFYLFEYEFIFFVVVEIIVNTQKN